MVDGLRPTAFRGDSDVSALRQFFQPERQFAGDTRWTFGTSLKSAYVNSFEFLNQAPVVQLWRDSAGAVRAVSQIRLGYGDWYYLVAPECRRLDVSDPIIAQADAALELLCAHPSWKTVVYESNRAGADQLISHGYQHDGYDEVFMLQSLDGPAQPVSDPPGCSIQILDTDNAAEVFERGGAQTDAFLQDQPVHEVAAWMTRTMRHQLAYGGPDRNPSVIAVDADGQVLAFADLFLDFENGIGEFEPVGTRKALHRRGLAKACLTRGLTLMREAGMRQAVVRTGVRNAAAIAAYESVGFEVADRLINFRKLRPTR